MKKLCLLLTWIVCLTILSAHADPLSLKSDAFTDGEAIPKVHTCDGKDISPDLNWSGVPAKSQSLALIMSDPDAPNGTHYHWILYNLPKDTTSLPKGVSSFPEGTLVGKNSNDKSQYNGPCPPKGSEHRYYFTLYALDTKLELDADATAPTVLQVMSEHILEKTELRGVFGH